MHSPQQWNPANAPSDAASWGAHVGGYEVLRRLGRGSRADVLLGRSDLEDPSIEKMVALKIVDASVSFESIERELDILSQGLSAHLPRLVDLTRGPERQECLALAPVLMPLPRRGGQSRSLEGALWLPEHAVTILSSVLAALHSLHEAGFAHGSLRPDRIMLDQLYRPVLIGLGHASRSAEIRSRRDFLAHQQADREAFLALSEHALSSAHCAQLVNAVSGGIENNREFAKRCEAALFTIAEPASLVSAASETQPSATLGANDVPCREYPTRFSHSGEGDQQCGAGATRDHVLVHRPTGSPGREHAVAAFDWEAQERQARERAQGGLQQSLAADPALDLLRSGLQGVRHTVRSAWAGLPRHRRRLAAFVFGGGIVVACVTAFLLPSGAAEQAEAASPHPSREHSASPATPGDANAPANTGSDAAQIHANETTPATDRATEESGALSEPVDYSENPVQALQGLLPHHPELHAQVPNSDSYGLGHRMGDMAILTATEQDGVNGQPPPILLERMNGGWRVRAIFADEPVG